MLHFIRVFLADFKYLLKEMVELGTLSHVFMGDWEIQTNVFLFMAEVDLYFKLCKINLPLNYCKTLCNTIKIFTEFFVQKKCCLNLVIFLTYLQAVLDRIIRVFDHFLNDAEYLFLVMLTTEFQV